MSFKSFIASAFIAATAAIAPAQAYTPAGGVELFSALDEAGVKITTGDCEAKGLTGTYGFFMPSKNWIHICEDVAVSDAQQWETIRHEAVHAAQFCMDSSMQTTVMKHSWIDDNYSKSDWSFIKQAYDKSDWLIEISAELRQRYSNYSIARIVNDNCSWPYQ